MRKITRTFYQALKLIATHARVANNNKGQACLVIHAFLKTKTQANQGIKSQYQYQSGTRHYSNISKTISFN